MVRLGWPVRPPPLVWPSAGPLQAAAAGPAGRGLRVTKTGLPIVGRFQLSGALAHSLLQFGIQPFHFVLGLATGDNILGQRVINVAHVLIRLVELFAQGIKCIHHLVQLVGPGWGVSFKAQRLWWLAQLILAYVSGDAG